MAESSAKSQINLRQRNKTRFALIALVVLFSLPVIGPFFYTPKSFVNRGDLIQPHARPLEQLQLIDSQGQQTDITAFQGKWTMAIVAPASCDTICQTNLYNIRQVRFTQGRRMVRVQLAWILLSGEQTDIDPQLLAEYPQVQRYNIPADRFQLTNDLFETDFGKPDDNIQRVYFIDPFGNLVMSFDPQQNPKDIQKDLGRLLRVSKAGEDQS